MRTQTFYFFIALAMYVVVGAACATQSNSANVHDNHTAHDMSNMEGHDMSNMNTHAASAPDAASQPFDLQFIDSMIHHHEGAVKMAEGIIRDSKRTELKTFAKKIIEDQMEEIEKMKSWREAWYPGRPSALNMDMPGMAMSEMPPEDSATTEVDSTFLDKMTPHHEGAIKMAEEALKKAEHPEIKQLAEAIIKAQRGEIEKMNAWKKAWNK